MKSTSTSIIKSSLLKSYLLKPRTSRNDPKPAKTSRNQPKPAKTTQKTCETTRNDSKFQNWGKLKFSNSFRFQTSSTNAQIWVF